MNRKNDTIVKMTDKDLNKIKNQIPGKEIIV